MLVPAKMCNTLQYAEKQTQNPPTARSWGFDPPSRHQAMDYINLGKTGLKVSRICLGCMTYGEPATGELQGRQTGLGSE
jgi:hypothetical protein